MTAHRLRRFWVAAAAGTSALAVALTGCSTPGGQEASAGASGAEVGGTLTFLAQGTAAQAKEKDPLVAAFEQKYPGVTVKTEYSATSTWDAFFSDLQTKLAGGKKYDLIYIPTEGQRLFASKGLIQPLDSWIERDRAEMDAFYASANTTIVEAAKTKSSTDGQTYFIPYLFNTMGMYYSKPTLAKAGVAEPSPDWTWDDFRAACDKLKAAGVEYCFDAPAGYFNGISPWLNTNGTDVVDASWAKATANTPAGVEAVSFVRSLVADKMTPVPGGTYDPYALFRQGRIAMFGGGAWPTSGLLDAKVPLSDIGIVPWPKKVRQGSPVGWGAQAMLKSSENKEAAWAFIKFLLSPQVQDVIGEERSSGAIPVLKTSVDKARSSNPTGYDYLYEALDYATPVPGPDNALAVQQSVQQNYQAILTGNATPEAGMAKMNAEIESELR